MSWSSRQVGLRFVCGVGDELVIKTGRADRGGERSPGQDGMHFYPEACCLGYKGGGGGGMGVVGVAPCYSLLGAGNEMSNKTY